MGESKDKMKIEFLKRHKINNYRHFLRILKILKNTNTEWVIEGVFYFNRNFNFKKYFNLYQKRYACRPFKQLQRNLGKILARNKCLN